ncbi:MAG TPA: flagellin [Terriglobales bacterium]|jgi:flagellin|nr:flagellin [Terriglobales bacterium]
MSISILNNIPSLEAQNALSMTQNNLNNTLEQLSTGQRINSGADDAAGLAIANGLQANITALTQSVQNASDGVGFLQVADGALSQITTLLNRAVTLATEAATGTVSDTQRGALDAEFTSIKSEIDTIGGNTTYNGQAIFTNSTLTIFMSDSTAAGTTSVTVGMVTVDSGNLNGASLTADNLTSAANATQALTDINAAIADIAGLRGDLGATSNQLQSATDVMNVQIQNLTNAESGIMSADIGQETSNLSKYSILQQTGIDALQQANSMQQNVLKLFQ